MAPTHAADEPAHRPHPEDCAGRAPPTTSKARFGNGPLARECQRLYQARTSLERLCRELRQEILDGERRYARANHQIKLLRKDAERRDREYATARRRARGIGREFDRLYLEFVQSRHRTRLLEKDAEQRNREFVNARKRTRLLEKDAEQRAREFANARMRTRLLQKDAEARDREFAEVRRRLRSLQHLSTDLAAGFLAMTASRRWRLGSALLSLPSRILGHQPRTVADDRRPLATALVAGEPPPAEEPNAEGAVGVGTAQKD